LSGQRGAFFAGITALLKSLVMLMPDLMIAYSFACPLAPFASQPCPDSFSPPSHTMIRRAVSNLPLHSLPRFLCSQIPSAIILGDFLCHLAGKKGKTHYEEMQCLHSVVWSEEEKARALPAMEVCQHRNDLD
jgi:hypothetical protein